MPKIDVVNHRGRTRAGEGYQYSYRVWVDKSTGIFSVEIPQLFMQCLQDYHHTAMHKDCIVFEGKDLNALHKLIGDLVEIYNKVTIDREIVIAYLYDSDTAYYIDNEGNITTDCEGIPKGCMHSSYHFKYLYSLKFFARGVLKITYTNSGGKSNSVYRKLYANHSSLESYSNSMKFSHDNNIPQEIEDELKALSNVGPWLTKLNSFTNPNWTDILKNQCKFIRYTENTARFFYELLMQFCTMDYKMQQFFGIDIDSLEDVIANRMLTDNII